MNSGIFFYGSKMPIFCVVNGKPNKEGNSRPCNTFKRRVLVLILCSLAWRFASLLLNSLYTAVLVFKLRPPQCLLTPIFTLMTSFFSFFFSSFIDVWYMFIQEIVQSSTGNLLFHLHAVNEDKQNRRTVRFG